MKNAAILKDDSGKTLGTVEILTDLSEIDRLDQKVDLLSLMLIADGEFHCIIGISAKMQETFELMNLILDFSPVSEKLYVGRKVAYKERVSFGEHDKYSCERTIILSRLDKT